MAPSIVHLGDGPAVEEELGDAGPGVAGVEGVADRAQSGGVDTLVQEQSGVSEGDEGGRPSGCGFDDVGEIAPTGGGVLVVGQQHVSVGRRQRR